MCSNEAQKGEIAAFPAGDIALGRLHRFEYMDRNARLIGETMRGLSRRM